MIVENIIVFVIIFIVSFLIIRKWNGKKSSEHCYPPSLPALPLVGSLPFLRNFDNIAKFFLDKSLQLGPMFTFRVGNKIVLTLNNCEVIEEALVKNSNGFSSRPQIYMESLANPNNKGIIFMDISPEWKRTQKLSLSILKDFGFGDKRIMEDRTLTEIEAMTEYLRKLRGKSFEPQELFFRITSNIIMNIMLGTRNDYDLEIPAVVVEIDRVVNMMDTVPDIAPVVRFIPSYKNRISNFVNGLRNLNRLLEVEINECQQRQAKCFVSEFIAKEGTEYDREQLAFIIRDLVTAGTDTTGNTLLWSLIALANNPEIQNRFQSEIDSVIPRVKSPTLQDRSKLPFVEATILEIFRWRTLIPLSIAHCTSRDAVLRGFYIPSGTVVVPNLFATHMNPTVWEDPDVFRPDRFLDKENNVVGRDRVITFSLGRRSCLGEILARTEIFLILTNLLQKFTVLPPEGQDRVCDKPTSPIVFITGPKKFSVRLVERQEVQ